jgi:RNA polymerase sigma-70 factor (ECF subfamily)
MGNLDSRSDAELLKRSLAGEESAFQLLYERLKTPLFRYAFYMTSSKTAAEEVIQEVFLFLFKNGNRYRESKGDVAGFVFGVTRNVVRRVQRREKIHASLSSDEVIVNFPQAAVSESEGLPTQAIRNQLVRRMEAAVASLPDHYRQVVVLCDLCEFSYAQAAVRLGCAVGTIRSRLNRAHVLLAQKVKQSTKTHPELSGTGTEECLT